MSLPAGEKFIMYLCANLLILDRANNHGYVRELAVNELYINEDVGQHSLWSPYLTANIYQLRAYSSLCTYKELVSSAYKFEVGNEFELCIKKAKNIFTDCC